MLSPLGWGCGLGCFPPTRRWLLNYWLRSWSWALIMPQLICSAEYDRTIAIRQTQPQPVRVFPKSLLTTNRWYYLFSKTLPLFSRGEGFRSLHLFKRTDWPVFLRLALLQAPLSDLLFLLRRR